MSPPRSRLLLIVLVALLFAPGVYGQQPDTTQLPEIAPREIEIRGERQIALPSLERQPLIGFASPPRVPTVPTDHQPYVGSYEQPLADLPESLPVPTTVSESMQPTAEPAQGFLEGGTGRYFRRFFEGRVGVPISATERLSLHGRYTGTESDPDDDVAEARVRLESEQEVLRLAAEAFGAVQRYDLHGATRLGPSGTPRREGFTGGGSIRLQSTGSVSASAGLHYQGTQYASDLTADAANTNELVYSQQQVELQGSASVPLPYPPSLEVTYRRSWLGGDPLDDTAFDLDARGTVSFFPLPSLSVDVGAAVLAYRTPTEPTRPSPGTTEATFIAPVVDLEWRISDGTRLHLRNTPRLGDTSLDGLYTTNPYAWHAPSLRPTLETTNAEAGLTLSRGPVRVVTAAGYRYAPSYRYFNLAQQNQGDYRNLYRVLYDGARILHARGQVALQGVHGVHASLGISVRDGSLQSLDSLDSDIPNFAPVAANAMVAVSFLGGDGFVAAHGRFESSRNASLPPQPRRADPYLSVDLEGSYALGRHVEILARAEHLSLEAPTRWASYPRPPAQISVGLRLRW